jgi:hypothetical protein
MHLSEVASNFSGRRESLEKLAAEIPPKMRESRRTTQTIGRKGRQDVRAVETGQQELVTSPESRSRTMPTKPPKRLRRSSRRALITGSEPPLELPPFTAPRRRHRLGRRARGANWKEYSGDEEKEARSPSSLSHDDGKGWRKVRRFRLTDTIRRRTSDVMQHRWFKPGMSLRPVISLANDAGGR